MRHINIVQDWSRASTGLGTRHNVKGRGENQAGTRSTEEQLQTMVGVGRERQEVKPFSTKKRNFLLTETSRK